MSTIGSSISAAAQCGLEMNEAIRAYNENELAQIKLNAAANKAANSLTMSSADATLISGLANASQMRSSAFGILAGSVASGTAGFGLMGMESRYASMANKEAQNANPNSVTGTIKEILPPDQKGDVELKTITPEQVAPKDPAISGAAASLTANVPAEKSAGVANDNNKPKTAVDREAPTDKTPVLTQAELDAQAIAAAKKAPVKRIKTDLEKEHEGKAAQMGKIGQFLPQALLSMGQSSGQIAGAQDTENKAKADAFAAAAAGIEKLLEANASTATQSQQSAQSLKESLIKAQAEMIMANRA